MPWNDIIDMNLVKGSAKNLKKSFKMRTRNTRCITYTVSEHMRDPINLYSILTTHSCIQFCLCLLDCRMWADEILTYICQETKRAWGERIWSAIVGAIHRGNAAPAGDCRHRESNRQLEDAGTRAGHWHPLSWTAWESESQWPCRARCWPRSDF